MVYIPNSASNSSSIFLRSPYYAPSISKPLSFNFRILASSFFFSLSAFYFSFSKILAYLASSFNFAFNFSSSFSYSAIINASLILISSVFLGSSNQKYVNGLIIDAKLIPFRKSNPTSIKSYGVTWISSLSSEILYL